MNNDQIALQLYTVRQDAANDFLGTLRRVADVGYRAVELAGYHGVPVADLRAALDEYGLRAMAAHVGLDAWESRPQEVISDLQTLGCEFGIVPWLPPERRGGAEVGTQLADDFNRYGALCRDAGLGFAYHNHEFEFVPQSRGTMFDALVDATDPALVQFEIDVYWTEYAGVDTLALLGRLGDRAPILHMKEMAAGAERHDAPFGEGIIAWEPVRAAATAARWFVVEQDDPADPFADIGTSLRNLERLGTATT